MLSSLWLERPLMKNQLPPPKTTGFRPLGQTGWGVVDHRLWGAMTEQTKVQQLGATMLALCILTAPWAEFGRSSPTSEQMFAGRSLNEVGVGCHFWTSHEGMRVRGWE